MNDPFLSKELQEHIRVMEHTASECAPLVYAVAEDCVRCFRNGNKLLLCGNGGSAADAQHIAAELVNRFRLARKALPAIALTCDSSALTSIGNDFSFDRIFSRQVEALGNKGDILVGLSTSGGSRNILAALETARDLGLMVVGCTGQEGRNAMAAKCDYCLVVPSINTARIQETHEFLWHVICGLIEERLEDLQHNPSPASMENRRG
jgi:D-sedoheptulose 7-phosphate isomerase